MASHTRTTDRFSSNSSTAEYPDEYNAVLTDIEPTEKYRVDWPNKAVFYCDFGILLQLEKAVGIDRSIAIKAVCTALIGCHNTCDENKTVVELAGVLVKNHQITASEIEAELFCTEFDHGDGDRAFETVGACSYLTVLHAIEADLDRPLAPTIPERWDPKTKAVVTYYSAFLAGYFMGRSAASK